MTRLITTLAIFFITILGICGCASPTKISPIENYQDFDKNAVGEWVNIDKATRGTVKLEISREEDKWIIEGWGACHPSDCNWGEVPLLLVANKSHGKSFIRGFAMWDFNFKSTYMTLKIRDNQLFVDKVNIFKDSSKRSNYLSQEEFHK